MTFADILYGVEGRVATIRLNRPNSLNALTPGMLTEIDDALDRAAADESVGAIMLTGEGRGFCSGVDLVDMNAAPPLDAEGRLDLGQLVGRSFNPVIRKMRDLPKPIVAAVNGVAAGAGANLALMADLTIAARSAYFLQAFVNIGLVPDAGGTWILPRTLGPQRARGLAMLGEKLPAEQAKSWGLIWDVADDDRLMAAAQAIASKLAAASGIAVARIKRAIDAAAQNDLATQLDLERDLQRECGRSQDFEEGVMAFREKRAPNFKNR